MKPSVDRQPTKLHVALAMGTLWFGLAGAARADVLTQRYDNARTGRATDPSITPTSVENGKWQKLWELPVTGAVYAQPLFVAGQRMSDGTLHDLVIVASAVNYVYAFDAVNYQVLWQVTSLAGPDTSDAASDPTYGCAAMSPLMLFSPAYSPVYGIGIQSTPVIDRSAGTSGVLYVSYRSNTTTNFATAKQSVAKIDLGSGAVLATKDLSATDLGQSPSVLRQRASLLLSKGVLYLGFGSHCENLAVPTTKTPKPSFAFRGVLLALDPGSLAARTHFETIPAGLKLGNSGFDLQGGGIWQASSGIAADDVAGTLFFTTGNALVEQTNTTDFSSNTSATYVPNSFVRLKPNVTVSNGQVVAVNLTQNVDWFTPYRSEWLNRADLDLGSAGVLLPPNTAEIVGGGKEGILYVLDRANLGGYSAQHWSPATVAAQGSGSNQHCITKADADDPSQILDLCDSSCYAADLGGGDAVTQKFPIATNIDCNTPNMGNWIGWPHIHGTPVFGPAADGNSYLYVWPEKEQLKAYKHLTTSPPYDTNASIGTVTSPNRGMPGGMLTLSTTPPDANGKVSSVIFAAVPLENTIVIDPFTLSRTSNSVNAGGLVAFEATPKPGINGAPGTLRMLWGDYGDDVTPYVHAKFVPPTVANGKVFLATFSNRVNVYGPGPLPAATQATRIAGALQNGAQATALSVDPSGTLAVFGHGNASSGDWPGRIASLAAGSGSVFPSNASIALDTLSGKLLAFAVAADGKLRMFSTPQATNAWSGPSIVLGTSTLPAGAGLATQHRGAELDVFSVGTDGAISVFKTTNTTSWTSEKLSSTSTSFVPGSSLIADLQGAGQVDVLAVDKNGAVRIYWSATTPTGAWLTATIAGITLVGGANLASGHRGTELDVFAIGGTQVSARPSMTCGANDPYGDTGCLKLMTPTLLGWTVSTIVRAAPLAFGPGIPGAALAAVRQGPNQLDVFFVNQTGAVMVYFAANGGGWLNAPMNGPPTPSGTNGALLRAMPGSPIAAFPSSLATDGSPQTIDVLVPSNHLEPGPGAGASGIFGASASASGGTWSNPFKAL